MQAEYLTKTATGRGLRNGQQVAANFEWSPGRAVNCTAPLATIAVRSPSSVVDGNVEKMEDCVPSRQDRMLGTRLLTSTRLYAPGFSSARYWSTDPFWFPWHEVTGWDGFLTKVRSGRAEQPSQRVCGSQILSLTARYAELPSLKK